MEEKVLLKVRADFCNQYNIFRMNVLYLFVKNENMFGFNKEKDFERRICYGVVSVRCGKMSGI